MSYELTDEERAARKQARDYIRRVINDFRKIRNLPPVHGINNHIAIARATQLIDEDIIEVAGFNRSRKPGRHPKQKD